jgi:hypothetical protein
MIMERNKMNDGDVEIIAISEIYKAVSVFSEYCKGRVTQPPSASFVLVTLLFSLHQV